VAVDVQHHCGVHDNGMGDFGVVYLDGDVNDPEVIIKHPWSTLF